MSLSELVVPVLLCFTACYALGKRVDVYTALTRGAEEGLNVLVHILPSLIALLTALTIVIGMRMMGSMLISSLIIFPALCSMRVFKSFRAVVVCAGALSVVCFCTGLIASYLLSTPVGASVVLCNLLVFLLCCLAGRR